MASVLDRAVCPQCRSPLDARAPVLHCASCGQEYPRVGPIPVLLKQPGEWLGIWRLQLGLLEHQGPEQLRAEEANLRAPGTLPLAASRSRAALKVAGDEAKAVFQLLDPL